MQLKSSMKLENREQEALAILNSMAKAIIATDEKGCVTFVNPVAEGLIGRKQKEVFGKPITKNFNIQYEVGEDVETNPVMHVLREGLPIGLTNHVFLTSQDRKKIPIEYKITPIKEKKGNVTGAVILFNEVTERREDAEEISYSENRFRLLFEYAPDGFYINDLSGNFVDGNIEAERLTGYKRSELIGKSFLKLNLLSPKQIPKAVASLAKNALGKSSGPDKYILKQKSGGQIPVEIRTYPLKIDGKIKILGIARDISEREAAERKIVESEKKYRVLFNQIVDPIFIFDQETHRFLDCNEVVHRIYGYTLTELKSMTLYDFYPPEDIDSVKENIDVKNIDNPYEYVHITKDGRRIDVEICTNEIDYKGRSAWISVVRDITLKKEVEIEKDELYHDLQERMKELKCLYDIDMLLNHEEMSIEETLMTINESIPEAFQVPEITCCRIIFEDHIYDSENFRETKCFFRTDISIDNDKVGSIEVYYMGKNADDPEGPFLKEERAIINSIVYRIGEVIKYKRVNESVKQQNKFLSNVIESLNHPFMVIDTNDYKILLANSEALKMGSVDANKCYMLSHHREKPCSDADHECPLIKIKDTKKSVMTEHIHYDENGNERHLAIHGYPIFDDEGHIIQMIEYSIDITERKKAEKEIEMRQNYLESILNNVPDAIVTIDGSHIIKEWSPGAERIFGFTRDEVIGENIDDLITSEDVETEARQFSRLGLSGKIMDPVETVRYRKDGKPVHVLMTASPIEVENRFSGAVVVYIDITSQKKVQQKLERSLAIVDHNQKLLLTLSRASLDIQEARELKDVYVKLGNRIRELGYYTMVFKLCDDRKHLEMAYVNFNADLINLGEKLGASPIGLRFSIKKGGLYEEILGGGCAVYFADIINLIAETLPGRSKLMSKKIVEKMKISKAIFAPLLIKGKVIGVLGMAGEDVKPSDVTTVETFVNQTAMVLKNIMLYQQAIEQKEVLKESEERFRSISTSAQDGIVMMDQEGNVSFWNDAATKIFGYEKNEIIGSNLHRVLVPLKYKVACQKGFSGFQKTGMGEAIGKVIELSGIHKDGTEFPVELSLSSVKINNKWNAIGIIRDISERKKADGQIRFLSSVVEQSADGMTISDMEGNLLFINNAWIIMHGYEGEEELLGQNLSVFHDKEQFKDDVEPFIRKVMEDGHYTGEVGHICRNGKKFSTQMTTTLLRDENDVPIAMAGVATDITERKMAERQLEESKQQTEKVNQELKNALEYANKMAVDAKMASSAKSEFLANMSHEIRTPMNGIIGMTDLALDSELTPNQREYLNAVKISADSLLNLINGILDFSRIEAGKVELETIDFSLQDCVGNVIQILTQRAIKKGVVLKNRLSDKIPDLLNGDPYRLKQIITNLIGNAIKFTDEGEIVVSVEVESHKKNRVNLHFSVTDTGIGIPKDKKQKIFDAFSQADGSTTRQYGGTGLGLAISAELAGLMEGKMWVVSPVEDKKISVGGPGSTFHFTTTFTIPSDVKQPKHTEKRLKAEKENEEPDMLANSEGKPLRILLAEDNPINQKLAEVLLRKKGWEVVTVSTGIEALNSLRSQIFDIILMDVQMPEMDGYEATKIIRNLKSEIRNIPIIAMTAHALKGDREKCLEAGMDDYIAKPIKAEEFYRIISEFGNGKISISETNQQVSIDLSKALESVDNDRQLLQELTADFIDTYPSQLELLRKVIENDETEQVDRIAHSLKGNVSIFGAKTAYDLANKLELMGRQSQLEGADEVLRKLELEMEGVKTFFTSQNW